MGASPPPPARRRLGAYNNSIALGSAGQIGHLSFTDGRGFGTNALAAPISLAGEGGDLRVDGRDYVLDISSSISGGSSSAILLLGGAEGQMIFNNNPASTYAGRTIVQQHTVDVTSNNLTFTGNVEIDPIGNVFLASASAIGGPITIGSTWTSNVAMPMAQAQGAVPDH